MGALRQNDFISALLQRWLWPDLLRGARTLVRLQAQRPELQHHYVLDTEEARFARETLVQWAPQPGCECSLQECLAGSVARAADADAEQCDELTTLIRACFCIALVYDERVRCFVMADQDVHTRILNTRPPEPRKLEAYLQTLRPLVDAALERRISLHTLCEMAIADWSSRHMYT